jgi:transposase-like protein
LDFNHEIKPQRRKTMAKIEITIDDEQIEALSERDGLAKLLQPVLNQILDAEMTEHVGAAKHERTDQRTGTRNGYYDRDLTTRVGPLELRVP